jgi:hypothetical protein
MLSHIRFCFIPLRSDMAIRDVPEKLNYLILRHSRYSVNSQQYRGVYTHCQATTR